MKSNISKEIGKWEIRRWLVDWFLILLCFLERNNCEMAVVTQKLEERQGNKGFFQIIITQKHSPSTVQEYVCKVRIIFSITFPLCTNSCIISFHYHYTISWLCKNISSPYMVVFLRWKKIFLVNNDKNFKSLRKLPNDMTF